MPHDRDALRALVEKVRAATGPDPELGWAAQAWIAEDVSGWRKTRVGPDADGDHVSDVLVPPSLPAGFCYPPLGSVHTWFHVPRAPVTASLDAAQALVRRVLPRWKLGTADADPTRAGLNRRAWAKVEPFLGNDDGWKIGAHEGFGATVPLAVLSALLAALLAQAEAETGGQHAQ